jgi:hypothetical protein
MYERFSLDLIEFFERRLEPITSLREPAIDWAAPFDWRIAAARFRVSPHGT